MKQTIGTFQLDAPSRWERKKAETRERIGRAAMGLISQRGLAATSVEEITRAADVAKGTFFNYFPSKEHIFVIFVETQHGKLRQAVAEAEQGRRSTYVVLRDLFLALAEEPGSSRDLAAALVSALLGRGTVREIAAEGMAEGRRLLARIFSLGQERGEVRSDADPRIMGLAFQEALFGALVVWAIQPEKKLRTRLSASFEAYWRGIAAGKGASK
jgi:AcrR family transcriptional regulator